MNNFVWATLMSHIMKVLEKQTLAQLRSLICPDMEHLQFASSLGVADAVIYLQQKALSHLE